MVSSSFYYAFVSQTLSSHADSSSSSSSSYFYSSSSFSSFVSLMAHLQNPNLIAFMLLSNFPSTLPNVCHHLVEPGIHKNPGLLQMWVCDPMTVNPCMSVPRSSPPTLPTCHLPTHHVFSSYPKNVDQQYLRSS